jgi:hypothetical protein
VRSQRSWPFSRAWRSSTTLADFGLLASGVGFPNQFFSDS